MPPEIEDLVLTSSFPTRFCYLHHPEHCWWNEEPANCIVCGQRSPGYGFIQFHEDDYKQHHVCEPCLVTGRLAERRLQVNKADVNELRQQLTQQQPQMGDEERELIVQRRTTEVECCTPLPAILNLFRWPAHCGDYLVFHRQVDADDLNTLAPDGDGRAFLASHLYTPSPAENEIYLDNVWRDRLKGFMRFYLWQCPQCYQYRLTSDSD